VIGALPIDVEKNNNKIEERIMYADSVQVDVIWLILRYRTPYI